jgi:mutator protein MutT
VRPEACVSAVVVEEDKLLLVRRARGSAAGEWALPGGRVEAGETLAEAVVREVAEETGLAGVVGEFVGWSEVLRGDIHAVILTFWVHLFDPGQPVAGDDAAEARWVSLSDVAAHRLVAGLGEFLRDHDVISEPVIAPSIGGPASR